MVTVKIPEEVGSYTLVAVKCDPDNRCRGCQWCANYNSHSPLERKNEWHRIRNLCDSLQPPEGEGYAVSFRPLEDDFDIHITLDGKKVNLPSTDTKQPDPEDDNE